MNLSLRSIVIVSIAAIGLSGIGIAGAGWIGQESLHTALRNANSDTIPSLKQIRVLTADILAARRVVGELMLTQSQDALNGHIQELTEDYAAIDQGFAGYADALVSDDQDRANLESAKTAYVTWKSAADALVPQITSGQLDVAKTNYWGAQDEAGDALSDSLDALFDYNVTHATAAKQAAEGQAALSNNLLIGVSVLFLALAAGVVVIISRRVFGPLGRMTGVMGRIASGSLDDAVPELGRKDEIGAMADAVEVFRQNGLKVEAFNADEAVRKTAATAREQMTQVFAKSFNQVLQASSKGDLSVRVIEDLPDPELSMFAKAMNTMLAGVEGALREAGTVLSAVADTDLTRRVEGQYEGAFGALKTDINRVADRLTGIVEQLRDTSRALKTATGELLSGANDLSERTTKQAATIEETAAAMEQLSQTVLKNAERAVDASKNAGQVTQVAEQGGAVMASATEAMTRISDSSSKISNIIGLIDDIAFQTNLLALNASVEAARAGEAGKGFAVVAVEVRRLAQSAAQASAEVKALIEQSSTEVASGSRLVTDAAQKLQQMLVAVRDNRALLDGIARDSREQAASIEEVSAAVRQMDEMTQHNAALVEETNAAIEQTESQANDLDRVVDLFRISGEARGTATTVAPAIGIRGLQQKVASAARSYLGRGKAA